MIMLSVDWNSILAATAFIWLIVIGFWVWAIVWATQKKGWIGFLAVFISSFMGWLVILVIVNEEKKVKEQRKNLRCKTCCLDCQDNLIDIEKGVKICQKCSGKQLS